MIDFATHRQRLHAKIAAVHASRAQQTMLTDKDGCEHEWKLYRQTVRYDRTDAQDRRVEHYQQVTGIALPFVMVSGQFKIKACHKCKAKHYVGYEVLPSGFDFS